MSVVEKFPSLVGSERMLFPMAVISFFPVCFRNHRNIIHRDSSAYHLNYFANVDSGCPSKQSRLQITPDITQDSLRSHTKDGGGFRTFKIKCKGLCCKFFFISTHLISVTNVVCTLISWIGLTQFCCFTPISFRSQFFILFVAFGATSEYPFTLFTRVGVL